MKWMIFIKIFKNTIQIKKNICDLFDDIIADILDNKKLNLIATELSIRGKKNKQFFCFYFAMLFCCAKHYQAKFYTLLHHENFKQARVSENCF